MMGDDGPQEGLSLTFLDYTIDHESDFFFFTSVEFLQRLRWNLEMITPLVGESTKHQDISTMWGLNRLGLGLGFHSRLE